MRRKKCRTCQKTEENSTGFVLPKDVRQALLDLDKTVNTYHITRVVFEASEHPNIMKTQVLATNTRTLLAAFIRQQELLKAMFGNYSSPIEEQVDDYHCVAGEEMDVVENQEGIY